MPKKRSTSILKQIPQVNKASEHSWPRDLLPWLLLTGTCAGKPGGKCCSGNPANRSSIAKHRICTYLPTAHLRRESDLKQHTDTSIDLEGSVHVTPEICLNWFGRVSNIYCCRTVPLVIDVRAWKRIWWLLIKNYWTETTFFFFLNRAFRKYIRENKQMHQLLFNLLIMYGGSTIHN
jgi:hypothetical protein